MIQHNLNAKARLKTTVKAAPVKITPPPGPQQLTQTIQDLAAKIADLESRLSALEAAISIGADGSVTISSPTNLVLYAANQAQLVGTNRVTVATAIASVDALGGDLTLEASTIEVEASEVEIQSSMVTASGVVKCDTIMANSVVGKSYTPGAGNIW